MKKLLLLSSVFFVAMFSLQAQTTIFSQNFSDGTLVGATTTTTYPTPGDPNKFDAVLSASGSAAAQGTVTTSVVNNKLRITRVAGTSATSTNSGGATRATDFSATDFMHYAFELSAVTTSSTAAVNQAYQLGIGAFTNAAVGYVATTAAFCKVNFNFTGIGNNFTISPNSTFTGATTFNTDLYPVTIDVYAFRNADVSITATYTSPGTTPAATVLTANSFDVYATQNGVTTKVLTNQAAFANTTIQPLTHFKFSTASVAFNGSADLDNVTVTSGGAVLPVSLISFTGRKQTDGITLAWLTAAEQNNSHFNIMRSSDGRDFSLISKIDGDKGIGNSTHNYSFTDKQPLSGINYYKLQQVDIDGKVKESQIVTINADVKNAVLTVYKSPARDKVILYYESDKAVSATVQVFDMAGRKIAEQSISVNKGSNTIPVLVNLTNGLHVAKLLTETGAVIQKF